MNRSAFPFVCGRYGRPGSAVPSPQRGHGLPEGVGLREVVHRHLDVVVAGPALPLPADRPPQEPVPPTVRDAGQLLHVEVDELARPLPNGVDGHAGAPVEGGQPGVAMAAEDAVGGGPGVPEVGGEPVRAGAECPPDP